MGLRASGKCARWCCGVFGCNIDEYGALRPALLAVCDVLVSTSPSYCRFQTVAIQLRDEIEAISEVALARGIGANKNGEHTWREAYRP